MDQVQGMIRGYGIEIVTTLGYFGDDSDCFNSGETYFQSSLQMENDIN